MSNPVSLPLLAHVLLCMIVYLILPPKKGNDVVAETAATSEKEKEIRIILPCEMHGTANISFKVNVPEAIVKSIMQEFPILIT